MATRREYESMLPMLRMFAAWLPEPKNPRVSPFGITSYDMPVRQRRNFNEVAKLLSLFADKTSVYRVGPLWVIKLSTWNKLRTDPGLAAKRTAADPE